MFKCYHDMSFGSMSDIIRISSKLHPSKYVHFWFQNIQEQQTWGFSMVVHKPIVVYSRLKLTAALLQSCLGNINAKTPLRGFSPLRQDCRTEKCLQQHLRSWQLLPAVHVGRCLIGQYRVLQGCIDLQKNSLHQLFGTILFLKQSIALGGNVH